jgi:hypothetical protein
MPRPQRRRRSGHGDSGGVPSKCDTSLRPAVAWTLGCPRGKPLPKEPGSIPHRPCVDGAAREDKDPHCRRAIHETTADPSTRVTLGAAHITLRSPNHLFGVQGPRMTHLWNSGSGPRRAAGRRPRGRESPFRPPTASWKTKRSVGTSARPATNCSPRSWPAWPPSPFRPWTCWRRTSAASPTPSVTGPPRAFLGACSAAWIPSSRPAG